MNTGFEPGLGVKVRAGLDTSGYEHIEPGLGVKDRLWTRGGAAFQRFVSADTKHYVFCVSDTKNV